MTGKRSNGSIPPIEKDDLEDNEEVEEANVDVEKEGSDENKLNKDNNSKNRGQFRGFNPNRVFVGQVPYKATIEDIKKHLGEFGVYNPTIRMLTEKKSGKFKGIAFVELVDKKQVSVALRAHHSTLLGRVINVERSTGGGGKGEKRKGKLNEMRGKQNKKVKYEVNSIVQEILGENHGFDDSVLEALGTFPRDISKLMLEEFSKTNQKTVNNKSAYIMGLIKRYRNKLKSGKDFVETETSKI